MSLGEIGSWRGSWLGAGLMGAKPMWSKARARSRVELDSACLDTSCCASSEALSSAENKTRRSTSTDGDRTGAWMNLHARRVPRFSLRSPRQRILWLELRVLSSGTPPHRTPSELP